ncbi:hypothetical protein B9T19_03605 [Ignatzschineria sp. F8392]|uniref:hypothetical protein n=1 Tax=Ignatzschineria sp. F8392 TaxID=1980117 RepID=UPI000B988F57|nr:hypothetical protein [Ignatzschineria sp. F8392]OYQ81759.1 hypothetical protein B9T19_03605 [Ignatzschineria sp. F8392]
MRNTYRVALATLILLFSFQAFAEVYVKGYTRKDGTSVQGHYRSKPNSTVRDNYSHYGNKNPRTGKIGDNKNRNDPSSNYYNGSKGYNNGSGKSRSNRNSYGW